jgi:serine/threonine protein kinase
MTESLEQVQQAFSAYTVERELGSGGMATVYLAHDKKHDRKVAIKILHAELAAMLGAERFLQDSYRSRCLLIDVIEIRNESIAGQVDEENSISLCGRHSIVKNAGHTAAMAPNVP